jgi:hypothetical protein
MRKKHEKKHSIYEIVGSKNIKKHPFINLRKWAKW